jgi:hypothetical protein
MTVYTDGIHLVADSLEELHAFAMRLGLRRGWFHNRRDRKRPHPHYDVVSRWQLQLAQVLGAKLARPRDVLRVSQACGERVRK